jgi:hypothetical protein
VTSLIPATWKLAKDCSIPKAGVVTDGSKLKIKSTLTEVAGPPAGVKSDAVNVTV